jgi:hypothetical protein
LSDLAQLHPAGKTALYGAAALVAAFELYAAWVGIHPHVADSYRAYFIDQTTTCLDQPSAGTYEFGRLVSFRSGDEKASKPLRVCGWEGPVGDGLHAVGESSRLRFALPADASGLTLMLEMVAVDFAPNGLQQVSVVVNGQTLDTLTVTKGTPQRFTLAVPDAALGPDNQLNVELRYPIAVRVDPQDSNTRKRSIKLTAGSVTGIA